MRSEAGAVRRHVFLALAVAGVSGGAMLPIVSLVGEGSFGWAILGFGSMAAIGIASGTSMVREHGTAGTGFLAAMILGTLAKLLLAAGGALAAARAGATVAYLVGLGAGYLPLQAFEVIWFHRATRPGIEPVPTGEAVGR